MSSRFARWFRGLSNGQALVAYGFLIVLALLTLWHNPTEGYRRTLTSIKVHSADEAIQNMKIRSDMNDWKFYDWWWKQRGIPPENGYFYMDENPWWWVYAHESKGFDEDTIPRFVRAPLRSLETLGGYLQTIAIVGVSALSLIWLMGLRKVRPE